MHGCRYKSQKNQQKNIVDDFHIANSISVLVQFLSQTTGQ
jgi:hypothetical protein